MQEAGFSIQFVSKVTGISAHTLRAWEKRYAAVVPARNEKGKRLYSQENIEKLKLLTELVQMGNSISDVANLEVDQLIKLSLKYGEKSKKITTVDVEVDVDASLRNLLMALHGFKLNIVSHELEKVTNQMGARDFSLKLLLPLLSEVGRMVHTQELSIAQEHAMSAMIRFHVGSILYKELGSKMQGSSKTIVLATPEGELHEFGILISALLCAHHNIKFIYLGPNMPSDSLSVASNQVQADVLLVGVSPIFQTKNMNFLEEYFSSVRLGLKSETELWIGGINHPTTALMQDGIILLNDLQQLDHKLESLF